MGSKGSANRQRIVAAADHLFYSRGYNQTSFSDISDETGIPRGNFYYYFKTKEDILSAVVDCRLEEFRDMLTACDSQPDAMQRLLTFVRFPLQKESEILRYGCPIGSLSTELAKEQTTDISPARLTAVFDLLKDWIETQLTSLGRGDCAADLSMDLLAKMQGVIILANVYHDAKFLHRGVTEIESWLQTSLCN